MPPQATTDPYASIATPIAPAPASAAPAASADPYAGIATPINPPASTPVRVSGVPPVDPALLSGATDVSTGITKGLGDTVSGAAHLIHKIPVIGETLAPQAGIDALDKLDESQNTAQTVGKGAEAAAEWLIPGLAEDSGPAQAAKLVALAQKSPLLAKTLNMVADHPWLAKLILDTGKGAVTGAVVGGTHGAQQGKTVKGAETGAAIGGAAAALPSLLVNPFTKRVAGAVQGYISDIWHGAAPAQEAAQTTLREGAQAGAGVPSAQPQAMREVLDQPIDSLESAASKNYQAMDKATGGKFQPNVDALKNVNQELRSVAGTNPAREAELEAAKIRLEWQRDQLLNEAEKQGVPKATVDLAKQQFRQAQALHDLDTKVFKNFNVVDLDGNVKIDNAIKALQKMQDNTTWGGPRLEQALGKDTADALMKTLNEARQQGIKAVSRQQLAKSFAKYVGVPAAGTATVAAGNYLYHAIFGQ